MYPYLGDFLLGQTIFIPFHTFNSSGASVTITGLAVTDIEVYKGASMTQRSSDSGYALVDTDGIDLDTITGIHGFTIDTSDNTDAGFWAAGNDYTVVVSSITADSQTVNFIAARFAIMNRAASYGITTNGTLSGTHSSTTADLGTNAPSNDISGQTLYFPGHDISRVIDSYNTSTGVATFSPSTAVTLANGDVWVLIPTPPASTGSPPAVNATQFAGQTITCSGGVTIPAATLASTTNITGGTITTVTNLTNAPTSGDLTATMKASVNAEVLDVLNVDTFAEPGQGTPAATTTLAAKINYLFKAWRNKSTQTSTQYSLYADDATTVDQKATCSSDGTTLTRGEVATGP